MKRGTQTDIKKGSGRSKDANTYPHATGNQQPRQKKAKARQSSATPLKAERQVQPALRKSLRWSVSVSYLPRGFKSGEE